MSLPVYACIWARRFATQALLRLRPALRDTPVAVLEGERPLERVCCLNTRALRLGAAVGMTRAQMETTAVPVHKRSYADEISARSAVVTVLNTFTPRLEDAVPSGTDCVLVMDITGTERAFGDPRAIANAVRERTRAAHLHVDIGISHNFDVAICVAASAFGRIMEVPHGYEAQAIEALPLAALRPDAGHAEVFSAWGIRTVGELAALPTRELVARTGERGRLLQARARGESTHLFQPITEAVALVERIAFDEPVELLEPLLFVINLLLEQLLLRTSALLQALTAVAITLQLNGGGTHMRNIRPALPTQDRALLLKLLQLDLEAHPPGAGVLGIHLEGEGGRENKVQLGLFTPQHPEPMRLEVTLARIAAAVGENNVGRARLLDSHRDGAHAVEKFTVTDTKQMVQHTRAEKLKLQTEKQERYKQSSSRPERSGVEGHASSFPRTANNPYASSRRFSGADAKNDAAIAGEEANSEPAASAAKSTSPGPVLLRGLKATPASENQKSTNFVQLVVADLKICKLQSPAKGRQVIADNSPLALRRVRPALHIPCNGDRPNQFHVGETLYRLLQMHGPWRTSGEWWSARVWSEECWDFSAEGLTQPLTIAGVLTHDRLRKQWRLEALYD